MRLGGWHKLTTLDFPGVVSAILFAQGCNFFCPYCHNQNMIPMASQPGAPELAEIMDFLRKRRQRGLLDGVVISGGEPTLQLKELKAMCCRLKDMGYLLKLDSNGSRPEVLSELLADNLLDYIAIDIKTPPRLYAPPLCGQRDFPHALQQCMELIEEKQIPHEFRTTAVAPFVSVQLAEQLLDCLKPGSRWFLQKAHLPPGSRNMEALPISQMEHIRDLALAKGVKAEIR